MEALRDLFRGKKHFFLKSSDFARSVLQTMINKKSKSRWNLSFFHVFSFEPWLKLMTVGQQSEKRALTFGHLAI